MRLGDCVKGTREGVFRSLKPAREKRERGVVVVRTNGKEREFWGAGRVLKMCVECHLVSEAADELHERKSQMSAVCLLKALPVESGFWNVRRCCVVG